MTVGIAAMHDGDDLDDQATFDDSIDDSVLAAARRVERRERLSEGLANAVGVFA